MSTRVAPFAGPAAASRASTPAQGGRFAGYAYVAIAVLFLLALTLGGGSSRTDVPQLPVLRGLAVPVMIAALWSRAALFPPALRALWLFAFAAAALMAAQMIPLPPLIWLRLPGRDIVLTGLRLAGAPGSWQPLSLTPQATLDATLALLPIFAAFTLFATVKDRPAWSMGMIGVIVLTSVALAVVQTSVDSARLFALTNDDVPVGIFANRNHQAALLAIGFPIGAWLLYHLPNQRLSGTIRGVALGILAATQMILLLVTGSRSGLILGILGATLSVPLLAPRGWLGWRVIAAIALAALVAALVLAWSGANFVTIRRFMGSDEVDLRLDVLGDVLAMLRAYFPAGAGYGSFVSAYQIVERREMLAPTYLNAAHNDLLQLGIEGGAPACALLLIFALWWTRAAWRLLTARAPRQAALIAAGRSAVIATGLLLLASLLDYPLRTPVLAAIFVVLCGLIATARAALPDPAKTAPPATT